MVYLLMSGRGWQDVSFLLSKRLGQAPAHEQFPPRVELSPRGGNFINFGKEELGKEMDMRNNNTDSDFYDRRIALSMLKRAIILDLTKRGAIPKPGEDGYWYAIGYHLIGGNKYLTDRQYDAIRMLHHLALPPTSDEVLEVRQGVSDRASEDY